MGLDKKVGEGRRDEFMYSKKSMKLFLARREGRRSMGLHFKSRRMETVDEFTLKSR
jgi:hypothetical protein